MQLRRHSTLQTAVVVTIALAVATGPKVLAAQATARDSVVAVVNEFFRAMEKNDSAAASRTVHGQGTSYSFRVRGDSSTMRVEGLSQFPSMLARNQRKYIERMWEPTVHVHGPIAVVWTPYDFHIDGKFSHCGVDAFTVARLADGWRIVNITYTTEQTGCKPSPLGPVKSSGNSPNL
jgi:hypothetical protein